MTDRRAITIRPDGSRWSESTFLAYLADMDRRAPRPSVVRRLSERDPFCVSEQERSRDRAA